MDGQDICGGGGGPTTTTTTVTTTAVTTTTTVPDEGSDCSNVVNVEATDVAQHTTDLSVRSGAGHVNVSPLTMEQFWIN
jgi:hypothetical protein